MVYMNKYDRPGFYRERVSLPKEPFAGMFRVRLTNEHGQSFEDAFHIELNVHFYRIIKVLFITFSFVFSSILLLPASLILLHPLCSHWLTFVLPFFFPPFLTSFPSS